MYIADRDTYKHLRTEYNRSSFKKMLRMVKPPVCIVCRTTDNVQYHHVLALEFGGNNNLENIVPMCPACHKAVHYSNHIDKYRHKGKDVGGRPRKAVLTKESEEVLWRWANGEIGAGECKDLLGYSPKCKVKDLGVYREFIEKHGIQNVRNKLDVIVANGTLEPGTQTSMILYVDGEREFGYYGSPQDGDV